jgi:putative serine/threonine protein kinase
MQSWRCEMEEIGKGKRGIVYLLEEKGKKYAIKKVNPKSESIAILEKEALFLRKLNKIGIGPRLYSFHGHELKMEFIDGVRILDFFIDKKTSKKEAVEMIVNVLKQCYAMDTLGINKLEMTNPYKHIIIRDTRPIMIDFERARFSEKPKNVTQFLQFLSSEKVVELLKKKDVHIDRTKNQEAAKNYKLAKNIKPILSLFQY